MNLCLAPLFHIIAKEHPLGGWVHIDPVSEVATDAIQKAVGVALAGEGLGFLRPDRILTPPGPIGAVGPLVDACHCASNTLLGYLRSVLNESSVLRKSSDLRTASVLNGRHRALTDSTN